MIAKSLRTAALSSLTLALCANPAAYAANDTWGANSGTAWYTVGNWASATQFPGLQGVAASNTDVATFTSVAGATTFGINMTTASLNLGAIVTDSTRTTAANIGNSTATAGSLRLYGATANSVNNTILWNAGTGLTTLQATQAGTMGVVLGNTTNVIQITNNGGITISSSITQINPDSGITLQGNGAGILTLSGTNNYTGPTTIAAGSTLQLATVASLYNGTTGSWTAANLNVSGTLNLNVGGTNQFTTGNVTTLLTNLGGLGGTVSNNGLRSGSRIGFDTTNAAGGNFTVADNIANSTGTGGGAIGVTKLGTGVLTLTGTNSYSGTTTMVSGTIRAGSSAAIGTNATLTVNGNVSNTVFASADATSLTFTKSVSTNTGGGGITFGDATGTGDLTFTGSLTRASGTTARNVNVAGTTTVTFNGNLTSPGSNNTTTFTKGGTGTLVIRGTGSGTDPGFSNVVVTSGVLAVTRLANLGTASSLGTATAATAGAVSITLNGGALNYITGGAAASSTNRLLQIGQTTAGGTGTIRNNATNPLETLTFSNTDAMAYGTTNQTRTLVLGGTNTGLNTLASVINNNGTGVVNVTKQDAGTWVLSGANSFTGGVTINDGTLLLGNAGAINSSAGSQNAVTFGASAPVTANLTLSGNSVVIRSLATNATPGSPVVQNASATPVTLTVGNSLNLSSTYAGTIQDGTGGGALALTKAGTGTLTLSGANSYTGGTTLTAGILQANHNNAFSTGGVTVNGTRLIVNAGVTVPNDINIGVNTGASGLGLLQPTGTGVGEFSGAINITNSTPAGGLFAGTATANLHLSGVITSSVDLTQRLNTVIYSGGGTGYTALGVTGTARVGATNGIATSATVNLGGSAAANLDLNGFNQSLAGITKFPANAAIIGNSSTTADSVLTTTGTSDYAGIIQNVLGAGTRTVGLTVASGALTLSGASTYTGDTTVSAGKLLVNGQLGNTAVSVTGTATIGGTGVLLSTLSLAGTSFLEVNLADPLQVDGTITFGSGFGIGNITGFDWDTVALDSPLTLLSTAQVFTSADIANFGLVNAVPVGALGRSAYFQNGSLQAVVVPETGAVSLLGLATLFTLRRRRTA